MSDLSLKEQAQLIEYIINRCLDRFDRPAVETMMLVTADDVERLREIAHRLHRMAPHELAIKRLVGAR